MAISQTNGYHVVLELSAARIAPIINSFIPDPFDVSVSGVNISTSSIAGRPMQVQIQAGNQFVITAVRRVRVLSFNFIIRRNLTAVVNVNPSGSFILSFPTPASITGDTAANNTVIQNLVSLIQLIPGRSGTTVSSLLSEASGALMSALSAISLPTLPVRTSFSTHLCAPVIREFSIHTINNSAFILVQLSGGGLPTPVTNRAAFTTSLRGTSESVLLIANESLLAMATCFASMDPSSPLLGATFSSAGACRSLVGTRAIPGTPVTITALSVCVVGSEIILTGSVTASGTGYSATGTFMAPIGFSCRPDGTIFPVFDSSRIVTNVSVSFAWWVYLAGFAIAAILPAILGTLVAFIITIVVALLSPIVGAIINALIRSTLPGIISTIETAVSSGYRMLPPALKRLLGQIQCQSVILDDLGLRGVLTNQVLPRVYPSKTETITKVREVGMKPVLYREFEVTNTLTFRSNTYNFFGTIRRQWSVNSTPISAGSGNININGQTVAYQLLPEQLQLTTQAGASIAGQVTLRVTDEENQSRFDTRVFDVSSIKRERNETGILKSVVGLEIPVRFRGFDPDDPCPTPWRRLAEVQEGEFVNALVKGTKISKKQINKIGNF